MEGGRSTRQSSESQDAQHKRVGGESETTRAESSKEMNSSKTGTLIKLIFLNAQSIVNKLDLLRAQVCELEPDIIAITESWTHSDITEGILKISGYELIGRRDRSDTLKGRGGGILLYSKLSNIYVNSVIKSEQVIHATITNNDKNSEDIQIHCFYRSPNASSEMTEDILSHIKNISSNSISVGDFNYLEIDWSTLSCTNDLGREYLETVISSI